MITDIFGIISTIILHDISCFFSVSFNSSPALFRTDFYTVNVCLDLLTGLPISLLFLWGYVEGLFIQEEFAFASIRNPWMLSPDT